MRVAFGDCTFDSDTRELFRAGKPVHLSPKAFRFLELLLESRPRALSKAELQERLWPKTFVSEANLASLAAQIRRAFGEKGRGSSVIRTVYGFGYAFAGEARDEKPAGSPARGKYRYCLMRDGEEILLAEGENIIGRGLDAAARIDESTISRHHARILVAGKEARIEDLGSKNGTFVEGKSVSKPYRLSDGDAIQVGAILLTFRVYSPERSTATMRRA